MNMRVGLPLFLALLSIAPSLTAQEYPYSMTVSTAPYIPLTSFMAVRPEFDGAATTVAANIGINDFSFWGEPVTGFTVYPRGAISFATATSSWEGGMFGLNSDYIPRSTVDPTLSSSFGYELQGMVGSRVLVFEWRNVALASASEDDVDSINYQVRFHEATDIVEVHVGPSHVASSFTNFDEPINGPILGIYHSIGEGDDERAMYFTGDPAAPQRNFTQSGFPSGATIGLNAFPPEGTVYRFAQSTSSVRERRRRTTHDLHVVDDRILVALDASVTTSRTIVLFDAIGRERNRIENEVGGVVTFDACASGVYLVEILAGEAREIKRVVVR